MSGAVAPDRTFVSDAPLGEVTLGADGIQVLFRRRYRHPIEKVWAALTIPERLADWFVQAEVDLRPGGKLRIFDKDMPITVCEPPHTLAWIWTIGGKDSLVRFDLEPEGAGCRLTLTHSGVPRGGAGVRAGWHAHLDGLADALEGRATPWEVKTAREAAIGPAYPPLPD